MRNSIIISSIASVVAFAISSVANAVVDVRGALRPQTREHQGYWLEQYLLGMSCLHDFKHRLGMTTPTDKRPDGLMPFRSFALAVCTNPRFASVSCRNRG